MGEHLSGIDKMDCVVLFAFRRRLAAIDTIVDAIVESGANVAFVTDEGATHRDDVRWHLRCQTLSTGPLFNHVSAMALCNLIVNRAIDLAGGDGRMRLRAIEVLNDRLGEL